MNSRFRQAPRGQEGQVFVIVLLVLLSLIGLSAFVVDMGFVLHAARELRISADAAAEASALDLTNNLSAATAIADANAYSMIPGAKNADPHVPNVSMVSGYPEVVCLSTIPGISIPPSCSGPAGGNAIAIAEQAIVPTFFGKLFGINSITLTAQSLALMKGQGTGLPGNLLMIIDTTASMADSDNDSTCKTDTGIASPTAEDCAKWGVRVLLSQLSPCSSSLSSCQPFTSGNTANPLSEVGLLTFPGLVSTADDQYDYDCQKVSLSSDIAAYTTPAISPPYYTIVPFSSDYRTSDTTTTLNYGSSNLVDSISWLDQSGCSTSKYGLQDPGGVHTYYAGVITEAQADITALNSTARGSLQSAIILMSDGDANATCTKGTNGNCESGGDFTTSTPYTESQNECQQAITAAKTAANTLNSAGLQTWVYSIAFNSSTSTSSSCSTDGGKLSGCGTMQQIASDPTKFYSDDVNGCVSPAHPSITSLNQIFSSIAYDFSSTRLLPFNLAPAP